MRILSGMALAGFVLAGAQPAAAVEATPGLADFARHATYNDIKISPNGDYVAASAIVEGKTVLSLIHLADMKGVNLRPRENRELAEFWWVAPQRVMYTIGERVGALEAPTSTGELFAVNADGTGDANIFGYRVGGQGATLIHHGTSTMAVADFIAALPDDPRHVLIASYPANGVALGGRSSFAASGVYPQALRLDLFDGKTAPVTTSPLRNARFLADNRGAVRFAYGVDIDQKAKVWYRAGDDKEWELVLDEGKDGARSFPERFNRSGDGVYFHCGGEHGVGGLCLWSTATHTMKVLWSGSEVGVSELVSTFDQQDAFAIRSIPDRTATTLLDKNAPEAKALVAMLQQFAGQDVRFTSASRDGKKAIFFVAGDTNPGEFYLYDAEARKASLLFVRRPAIDPAKMALVEPIALKARDGLALHGYLTRPPGKADAKNLPTVVLVHGGPYEIRDTWYYDSEVQALASRGYAVLQVNFRGSGGYGAAFVHAGFREWGGKMQDDVTDATRWAIQQGVADPKRICIYGGSYGGYAALEGAVKEPDLYRCAIGYVGVYDLRLMHSRGDIPQSTFGENYLHLVLGDDESVLWDRSPIAHLDRLKAKVMLVVGGQDVRVPPIHGENLHAALDRAHIAHEWLYERTEGHGFYEEGHRTQFLEKLVAFLDGNIGPAAEH